MQELLDQLSSPDAAARRVALDQLFVAGPTCPPTTSWVNMHMHTFFSFNGEGFSPSRLAWEARHHGLYAIAICDFDVLHGLREFLGVGSRLGMRSAVGFESRTFFAEFAEHEINSPGEPGVFYFMGMGFVQEPPADSDAGRFFADMLARSHQRNRDLIARVNGSLGDLELDYETNVLPLTPRGNATERHIVRAYHEKALADNGDDPAAAAAYWAGKLGLDSDAATARIGDTNGFLDLLRSKLMKRGGLGYAQPTRETFPHLDDVIAMILACEAIPMSTWLDGTSPGEADPAAQLECLMAKGVAAVNIIPDRNWNIKDPDDRARKVAELNRYVEVADGLDLPINVGTELNKPGQPLVDGFEAEPMKPLLPIFLRGAEVMIGHTRLLQHAGFSYVGEAAAAEFPDRKARNDFFAAVGRLLSPDAGARRKLDAMSCEQAYSYLQDSARAEDWQ